MPARRRVVIFDDLRHAGLVEFFQTGFSRHAPLLERPRDARADGGSGSLGGWPPRDARATRPFGQRTRFSQGSSLSTRSEPPSERPSQTPAFALSLRPRGSHASGKPFRRRRLGLPYPAEDQAPSHVASRPCRRRPRPIRRSLPPLG